MKEKGIVFTSEGVRAILDGRKTQTRRVMNPQPDSNWRYTGTRFEKYYGYPCGHITVPCPYGEKGDNLWVRETWNWGYSTVLDENGRGPKDIRHIVYLSDGVYPVLGWKWRPSRFMPRAFSRINLEIISVRVERLQDISNEDVLAEGCELKRWEDDSLNRWPYSQAFAELWDSINAHRKVKDEYGDTWPYHWGCNPWVWVIKFKVV